MSIGEKIYLAVVVLMFVSFMVLMVTLCALDARDEKLKRWRDRKSSLEAERTKTVSHVAAPAGASTAH